MIKSSVSCQLDTACNASAMKIHVSRDGQQFGPYSPEDVQKYLAEGSLLASDLGWMEGEADWVPLPQLMGGSVDEPPPVSGISCPKCGAGLDLDQVVCLSCGHNLDDPIEEPETAAGAPKEKRKVPPSLTYENEMADRSSFVNSVGWGLVMASLLPVFGDGQWNVPAWKFWELGQWQLMFSILAPVVVGFTLIILATALHGRARGVVIMVLALMIYGVSFSDSQISSLELATPVEDAEPIPEPFKKEQSTVKIPEKKMELKEKNVFYEKMDFDPGDHFLSVMIFLLGWFGLVVGAKTRYYRIESFVAYIIAQIGAVAMIVFWVMPGDSGMPIVGVIDFLSSNLLLGLGLLVMMLMQIGAAVLCFINTLGRRPSQMKQFSNTAVMLVITSIAMPVLPAWGKVIWDECKDDHERAKKRLAYVESQFGTIYTGNEATRQEQALNKVEKPYNAVISASCGWLMNGVKYVAWIGGLMILLPLGVIEIICGTREREEGFIVQQQ